MKAVSFSYLKDQTKVVEIPTPTLSDNEVLVKVKYSALDTAFDAVINKTLVGGFLHKRSDPLLLGWHFSGIIIETGKGIAYDPSSSLKVGSAVFGHLLHDHKTEQGAISEYIAVPATYCAPKPDSISWELAAASTVEGLTALQALRDYGNIKKNPDSESSALCILINGAGGQVGGAAVQIAKRMGAHVTAICSTKDVDRVAGQLGADVVIDRGKTLNVLENFQKGQFDIIFDTPNVLSSLQTLRYLKPRGRTVMTVPSCWSFVSGFLWSYLFSRKKVVFVAVHPRAEDLNMLGHWLEDGLTIDIDSIFPARDMESALARNRDNRKKGRVVVKVEDAW